jgi:aryl-alcohol dehydrogenase-like predicted oxidoreductase
MLAHGFTVEQLAELVRAGLATVLYAFNSPARRLMRAARVAAPDGAEVVRSGE